MTETVPKHFGKCLALKQLGQGATAVVLLARHEGLGILVAVKVLKKPLSDTKPNYAARFLREARMAARLDHPNIVRVIDCGVEDGFHYMVMDYVDGPNCLQTIKETPNGLQWREATEVIRQAALGLGYAAGRDVIHRDVKPSNLMIDSSGRVRVTDLGLAKMTVKGVVELTQEFHTVGTPSYMSPEQIRSATDLDVRSDIYSLGATFYHLLCGRPPFAGEGPMDVVAKHLTERLVPPIEVKPDIPKDLSAIVCKMMAKSPGSRYQNYDELCQDLQNVLEGHEVTATGLEAVAASSEEKAELQQILDELNLQASLEIEDAEPAVKQPKPEGAEAAPASAPKLDPFGPGDQVTYKLPESVDVDTAVMARTRPAEPKTNVGLIIALAVFCLLVLLAVVLGGVLHSR